ncbi:hemerythrin domain-containing protein [Kineosporia babensis]|uniref:Hemerythrin domain-containing protein n=1 Tax=Kineosporia babensis TaxID=499548 RepID=A0A9X1NFA4_9ACTN|nr:hemerythrin domain-containing protein [Kineosporia babensis]MCD5314057.1 hemerythrin domain-containing protein [Kineosporia babensis]
MDTAQPRSVEPADSRDMVGAHDMFRLHFGALPELVRSVADEDQARVPVIAEHVGLLASLLHGHHASEDAHVWPKLHERCPDEIQSLVATMESQHAQIDIGLQDLEKQAQVWAQTGDPADRDALAASADRLNPALREHLELEEGRVLRLIDTYLSQAEWKETVAASAGKLTPASGALAIGMMLDQADPDMQELIRAGVPDDFWAEVRPAAVAAYDGYAERVYGSARP